MFPRTLRFGLMDNPKENANIYFLQNNVIDAMYLDFEISTVMKIS